LKALELLLFGFSDNIKLLKHFFKSYQKNYSFDVVGISEVEEPSTSEYFDDQSAGSKMFSKQGQKLFKNKLKKQLFPESIK
jgi:hypothetical protein